ncbi:MAG: OmpA family protein [Silvibacterium sp.]
MRFVSLLPFMVLLFQNGARLIKKSTKWRAILTGAKWAVVLVVAAAGCNGKTPAPAVSASSSGSASASSSAVSGGDQPGSLAARLGAITSGAADKPAGPPLPGWKPIAADVPNLPVPLVKGLLVETAIAQPIGDYESFKAIQNVTPTVVSMGYSAAVPEPRLPGTPAPPAGQELKLKHTTCVRQIDTADLAKAHAYNEMFCGTGAVEHFPGTTAITASTEVLNQLRAGQQVDFSYDEGGISSLMQMFMPKQAQTGAPAAPHPGQTPGTTYCQLHRVETADLAFPVLVNQQPVTLPALHATCTADNQDEIHIYYLDQPANALTLAFQIGSARLQVIRITIPPPSTPTTGSGGGGGGSGGGGAGQMEQALAEKKPVEIYGIYFDFNSSVIKPESEPVLQQISGIMHKNPDWKLSVSGHTDNIGDDGFNMGLSQRRAAAVKAALVTRYGISADRLTTSGYGASQPIADNKTLEGRARNRRVELQRQ